MTTTALEYAPWSTLEQEKGVSDDASTLRRVWDGIVTASESITRGLALEDIRVGIRRAVLDAIDNQDISVEESTVRYAEAFATALPSSLQQVDVSIDFDGDISFDWDFGKRRVFAVSVRRDGVLNYAGLFGLNRLRVSEVLLRDIPSPILQGILRAQRGR